MYQEQGYNFQSTNARFLTIVLEYNGVPAITTRNAYSHCDEGHNEIKNPSFAIWKVAMHPKDKQDSGS